MRTQQHGAVNLVAAREISSRAIIRAERMLGSGTKLARAADSTRQNVNNWKIRSLIPYEKAALIFVATRGKVTLYDLRPDLKKVSDDLGAFFIRQYIEIRDRTR